MVKDKNIEEGRRLYILLDSVKERTDRSEVEAVEDLKLNYKRSDVENYCLYIKRELIKIRRQYKSSGRKSALEEQYPRCHLLRDGKEIYTRTELMSLHDYVKKEEEELTSGINGS